MNSNIHENVALSPQSLSWQATETTGLEKALLDQVTWETSFLRAQPAIPIEMESEGKEILVLSGQLICDGTHYTRGSYFRFPNPENKSLQAGPDGVLFFLKAGHFEDGDHEAVTKAASSGEWRQGLVEGLSVMPLHRHQHESIAFVKWAPNTQFNPHTHPGGEEIIVLEGTFHDEHGSYPAGSWLRNKPYSRHTPHTEEDGALIYVKTGHLPPK